MSKLTETQREAKIDSLLARLSLREKCAQLTSVWTSLYYKNGKINWKKFLKVMKNGIGHVTRVHGVPPDRNGKSVSPSEARMCSNKIQKYLLTKTNSKIPAIIHEECLSGVLGMNATQFPQSIGLGCTFKPESIEKMTGIIRRQMRALGSHQGLAPVADIARDFRYGRIEETYGEDPYLIACCITAYTKGLQGHNLSEGIAVTLKHFAGQGVNEGGRNIGPVHLNEREYREKDLFPFETAIRAAGAYSVMNAYHEIDGMPCAMNRKLLTEILRGEWGFKGYVVSDYGAILRVKRDHGIARDYKEAAALCLNAGLDLELPQPNAYYKPLMAAVKEGLVTGETLDNAVRRVLRAKFDLGAMEKPYTKGIKPEKFMDTPKDRKTALQLARESLVLLKNNNRVLPLKKAGSIAVIGPNADSAIALMGDYHYSTHFNTKKTPVKFVSILEGIKNKAGEKMIINYARGCDAKLKNLSGIPEAVSAAKRSDVIVTCVGDLAGIFLNATSGEGCDKSNMDLTDSQLELLKALKATGKPLIVVMVNARPHAIPWVAENADAILEAWKPGEEGGNAVSEVLFGAYNPGGKLCVSLPHNAGQLPINYNRKPSGFINYMDIKAEPLYPFGYGLSYTKFEFGGLKLDRKKVAPCGRVKISCTVRNTGKVSGDEVVQLYIRDEYASLARPVKELKGFKRLTLRPKQKKKITFELHAEQLAFYNKDMELVVEPGKFLVMLGSSSADIKLKTAFNVVGETHVVQKRTVYFTKVEVK